MERGRSRGHERVAVAAGSQRRWIRTSIADYCSHVFAWAQRGGRGDEALNCKRNSREKGVSQNGADPGMHRLPSRRTGGSFTGAQSRSH